MTSDQNGEALLALKRKNEAQRQEYFRLVADIKVRKEQYQARMDELAELGCPDLDSAVELEKSLQSQIEQKIAEIRELL